MDFVREAFQKVKREIDFLNNELLTLKSELSETRQEMLKIVNILKELTQNITQNTIKSQQIKVSTSPTNPTHQHTNQTSPTYNPTHQHMFNKEKQPFSTGNEGVPTDRQTNQQTDNTYLKESIFPKKPERNSIENAAQILDSLDSLKKEIRRKFKQLTDQELLVFSTLYQLEEDQGSADYKTLATKLNLTESSIRDYVGRLLNKGIPIDKKRVNNKQILLSISQNLKKVASLSTILQLRDI